MNDTAASFPDVGNLLTTEHPTHPVYCIYPHVYRETAKEFLKGFPGRVLYAVKANAEPAILDLLIQSGIGISIVRRCRKSSWSTRWRQSRRSTL